MATPIDEELAAVLERWRQSMLEQDVETAAALRDESYTLRLPSGEVLTRAQELVLRASSEHRVVAFRIDNVRVEPHGRQATVAFDAAMELAFAGVPETSALTHHWTLRLVRRDGAWKAVECLMQDGPPPKPRRRTVRESLRQWLRRRAPRGKSPSFQELAYLPYRPGEDYALPHSTPPPADEQTPLPIPPRKLWLGFDYTFHGKVHVDRMLEIVQTSDFAFRPGDRILDFGCGAGRMIRHLQPLAATCEVWGTDISAEHILWCKRHLSPPFHFATTTKVPHLPFEDRSFRFIYCGSVFTHIDDLADAWLLELRRILEPDGRLYVTLHDEHTRSLLESGKAPWLQWLRQSPAYREARGSFDMFTVGRDHESQVFYDQAYFQRMVSASFDVLSVTPEAYFYQTAVLLRRR